MWVESIFVKAEYRRHGVATALHSKAEEIAASNGDDTVYNYVHPNNHCMIEFLRKRGYTVLNLIELRKLIICKYEDIADYKSIVSEHIVDRLVRFDAIYTESVNKIVDIIDYPNGRSMALYEMEVTFPPQM